MSTCGHLLKGMIDKALRTMTRVTVQKIGLVKEMEITGGFLLVVFFPSTWTPSLVSRDK